MLVELTVVAWTEAIVYFVTVYGVRDADDERGEGPDDGHGDLRRVSVKPPSQDKDRERMQGNELLRGGSG